MYDKPEIMISCEDPSYKCNRALERYRKTGEV